MSVSFKYKGKSLSAAEARALIDDGDAPTSGSFVSQVSERLWLPAGSSTQQILAAFDSATASPAAPQFTIPEMLEAVAWGRNEDAAATFATMTTSPPRASLTTEQLRVKAGW